MIDLIHVERHYNIWITTCTSWTRTHEYGYEHEHENLNDKRLRKAYTWNYLAKWYMVIIWVWQSHGGMVIFGTWFTQRYSCCIINLVVKTIRHGATMGEIDSEN